MHLPVPPADQPSDPDERHGADIVAQLSHLRRLSRALTRNQADADDLVQDACVRALRSSDRFRAGTNLKAWVSTILRNLTLNYRRDAHRRQRRFSDGLDSVAERVPAPGRSPSEFAALDEAIGPALKKALESMPKSLRDAVWLRDVEEFSYAAIAERLHIPLGTVMSRIARGRRLLHDRLLAQAHAPSASPAPLQPRTSP